MIWCVEDDASICSIEAYALNAAGFETKIYGDGLECWQALQKAKDCGELPTLMILDIMLPALDGMKLLGKMRQDSAFKTVPVILATAKGSEFDKIQGFECGADDYLVKPFGVRELISRVKAILRRYEPNQPQELLKRAGIVLNLTQRIVMVDGKRIGLTHKEFELLKLFLTNPGIAFSRNQLFDTVWGLAYSNDTRTLDVHIRTLRQKLGEAGKQIETVRSVGYRLSCS